MRHSRRLLQLALAGSAAIAVAAREAHAQSPAPIWTGLYVGGSVGYQTGELENLDVTGVSGGGHVGYALQANGIVLGLEGSYNRQDADWSITENDGITTDTTTLSFDNALMIKARVGVPVGQALLYATAGVAWTDAELGLLIVDNAGGGSFSLGKSEWSTGYVVGGGVEIPLSQSIRLRGEAIYQSYDVEFDFTSMGGEKISFDYDTTLIQAGVSYYFN